MTLQDFSDQKVKKKTGAYIQSVNKLRANDAVLEVESRLCHKGIVGTTSKGRQGLGTESTTRWTGASARERRKVVRKEIQQQIEQIIQWRWKPMEIGQDGKQRRQS